MNDPSIPVQVTQVVPFLSVRDVVASSRFYTDLLGFEMTNRWVVDGRLRWCWLQLGGAALMLQELWYEGPHRNVPAEALGAGVSLYFICDDAIALYQVLKTRGVDAREPFVGNRMWVVSVLDPDGYRLFFESPTSVPEETLTSDPTASRSPPRS